MRREFSVFQLEAYIVPASQYIFKQPVTALYFVNQSMSSRFIKKFAFSDWSIPKKEQCFLEKRVSFLPSDSQQSQVLLPLNHSL